MINGNQRGPNKPNNGGGATPEPPTLPTAMPISPSPREVVQAAKELITESAVDFRQIGYVYLFQVDGDNGGLFYLDLKNGNGSAGEGLPPGGEPDVTLTLSVSDLQSMILGNTKPLQAYMSGKMKVSGDISTVLSLDDFAKKVVERIRSNQM